MIILGHRGMNCNGKKKKEIKDRINIVSSRDDEKVF